MGAEAFFFGSSEEPLYGMLHEPTGARERGVVAVLCPPIGQEYLRTHWALRRVARALTGDGYHVLRFDWSGTGDSWGGLDEATVTVDRWIADIATAAREAQDAANVRRVSLVGLRLGAGLAALAATRMAVRDLVLWDPVVDGQAHLAELDQLTAEMYADRDRFSPLLLRDQFADRLGRRIAPQPHDGEIAGFTFSPALRASIAAIDVAQAVSKATRAPTKATLIVSTERPEYRALERAMTAAAWPTAHVAIDDSAEWDSATRVEDQLTPRAAIEAVAAALGASAAGVAA